ncbi:hypothetical protein BJ085DRAFT_22945 [Dimargaris cristalligena]|uniref:Tyr recombinase domain-containing protein n=1 Tax=Dimargaris cristalligena TaxID=215637 RepID=A0A4P9ZK42_9FUNG|nr:hypothetical protein BJ085DRAFT_22945 [Dimargaris cristalligena]|eukprot:RKP33398.1 hypothetical protein BJ085DRAFT_22945 [Dimargaris cristalligena]
MWHPHSDLTKITLTSTQIKPDHESLILVNLVAIHVKERDYKQLSHWALQEDPTICPVRYLAKYLEWSVPLQHLPQDYQNLFTVFHGHHNASGDTLAQWLKLLFQEAGINTSQFTAHSFCAMLSTVAKLCGVKDEDIL